CASASSSKNKNRADILPVAAFSMTPEKAIVLLVDGHPLARFTQRLGDIELRHGCREFSPHCSGTIRPLEGGNVEPFVGGNQVNVAVATRRIHHAQFEQDIRLSGGADI